MKGICIILFFISISASLSAQGLRVITSNLGESVDWHVRGNTQVLNKKESYRKVLQWQKRSNINSIEHIHKPEKYQASHTYGILKAQGRDGDNYRIFYLSKKDDKGKYKIVKVRITQI